MGKYNWVDLMMDYGVQDPGDGDLDVSYNSLASNILLEKITNELAEGNRLKRIELRLQFIDKMNTQNNSLVDAQKLTFEELEDKA